MTTAGLGAEESTAASAAVSVNAAGVRASAIAPAAHKRCLGWLSFALASTGKNAPARLAGKESTAASAAVSMKAAGAGAIASAPTASANTVRPHSYTFFPAEKNICCSYARELTATRLSAAASAAASVKAADAGAHACAPGSL